MTKGFRDMSVRFFIYDEEIHNNYDDTYGDYKECEEIEFMEAEGVIEYERFTVFENGCRQVCLTKNPFI